MRHKLLLAAMALCMGTALASPESARAGTVLYDSANFIQGQESFVQSFTISTPGTLTVSLTSVPWLDTIQGLSFFVTSGSGVFGSMGSGTQSMSLLAGTYFAHWFGDADGQYQLGVDQLTIQFQPTASTVPLPGSLLLLLAGLGLLFGWQRRGDFKTAPVDQSDGGWSVPATAPR